MIELIGIKIIENNNLSYEIYLVYEKNEMNLKKYLKKHHKTFYNKSLSAKNLILVLKSLAMAINYINFKNIILYSIKPENIYIEKDNNNLVVSLKVGNFDKAIYTNEILNFD